MEYKLQQDILSKLKRRKFHRFWLRLVSAMMCIVVFCTTYALILPAITQETEMFCGLEEHIHSSDCYPLQGNLICEFADAEPHIHTDECQSETILSCTLEETMAHTHTDDCVSPEDMQLSCTLEEVESHVHTDACGLQEEEILTCTQEESEGHIHTEECYVVTTIYSCDQEETVGHSHTDSCYTTSYSCGQEETEGHLHTDICYSTVYGCNLEETDHIHVEECYATSALVCTLEEDDTHTHGEECYNCLPICQLESHKHVLQCYSNPAADLEDAAYWESTLPSSRTGIHAEDLLAVAKSQLGYTESTRNYIVEEPDVIKGYTRYGTWYGSPYSDWSAVFVSFCLHYAQVDVMPLEAICSDWLIELQNVNMYEPAADYTPKVGDLIFFDWDEDANADHMGIVAEYFPAEGDEASRIQVIEGDCNNTVCFNTYNQVDPDILGYGVLPVPPSTEPPVEGIPQPEETVGPKDTAAWAVLVYPDDQSNNQTNDQTNNQANEVPAVNASTYRLSNSLWNMARATEVPLDLTSYINAVTMYDVAGNVIPNGSLVTEGDRIEFRIEYTLPGQQLGVMNGENVTVKSNTLTYGLPGNIVSIKDDSGEILNNIGQTVGEYVIDGKARTLTMTFTDDYVEQNAKGIQIHGFISFFSTVTKETEDDHENQDFKFTDGITLGVQIEEKIESVGNLSVKKNKLSVVGEDLVYELIVESTEGTKEPIVITDQMSTGLTFVEGLEVTKGKIGTPNSGTPVTEAQFQAGAENKSFTLTLPAMAAGDAYTVIYKCKADVDLLGADMTVQNTATVTSKDSQDKELKDRTTVSHTFDMLEKEGVKNDDGTITWTITINQAKANISGWILDDFINGNQHFDGTVTIRNSRGSLVAQNVTLPYTFPQNSTDTYTVTYTTEYNFDDGSWMTNKAVLRDNDTTIEKEEGVEIGSPITKSGVAGGVIDDGNNNALLPITWTVTIDTSMGPIAGDEYLNDIMYGYSSEDMYMTAAQIQQAYNSINDALIARTGEGLQSFTAYEYKPGNQEGDRHFYPNLPEDKVYERFAAQLGNNGIPQSDNPITFTYEAYGVFPDGEAKNSIFTNRFNIGGKYEVVGTVRYSVGGFRVDKQALVYFDPSLDYGDDILWWHEDVTMGNGAFTQMEYEKLHDGYLSWTINVMVELDYSGTEDVVIYEDIPEGLTVCDAGYYFQRQVPVAVVRPEYLIPGQSSKTNFKLYPAENYLYGAPTGDDYITTGITFEVTESGDLKITIPSIVCRTLVDYVNLAKETFTWVNDEYGETFLSVHTKINDDFAWTTEDMDPNTTDVYIHNFENRVEVRSKDGKVLDSSSQTQQITKNESDAKIRKEASVNSNNNLISYSVVLNAYGKDLIPNSDTLHIEDVMTYDSTDENQFRVRLVPDTVRLYEVQMHFDGSYTKLKDITPYYKYQETSALNNNGGTTWTNTITMDVPDGKSLALEYRYLADGIKDTGENNVGNTCTITGVGDGGIQDNDDIKIEVKKATAQADTEGITLCKVDSNSDGVYLEGAVFHMYIWNAEQQQYIPVHKIVEKNEDGTVADTTKDFITDSNGQIVLSDATMTEFAYNTAYYMKEVQSPAGYILDDEPFYFQIVHMNTEQFKPCVPDDFDGASLTSGDIIYRENTSGATEIAVEKYWQDMSGQTKTVFGDEVSSVTLKLWQKVEGSDEPAVVYGTYEMTPDYRGNWKLAIKYLPKETKDGAAYLYYIEEVGITTMRQGDDYLLESTENNDGINSGTITLTNKQVAGYLLPETGGTGAHTYTMAGMLVMLTSAAYLVYRNFFRRGEEF